MTRHLSKAKMLAVRVAYRSGWLFFVRLDVIEQYVRSAERYIVDGRRTPWLKRLADALTNTTFDIGAALNGHPPFIRWRDAGGEQHRRTS